MNWDWTSNGWFWGWWMLHGLGSLLYLILVIVAIVVLARVLSGSGRGAPGRGALAILQERYAKGEIDREEYLQKKHDLGG